jgi:hypothetical protein
VVEVAVPEVLATGALTFEAVPEELPPHAARPTLARVRMARTPAAGLRRAFSMVGIELLFR